MWTCIKCGERIEDRFDACWKCGTSQDGAPNMDFCRADNLPVESRDTINPISCPRCEQNLNYIGTKKFHEGTRAWSFLLGDIGELFVNREHFDIYMCPRCGRVEFFVDGVGEEFRPH